MDDRKEVGGKDFKKYIKLNILFLISLLFYTVVFVASLLYYTVIGVDDLDGYQLKLGIKPG